MRFLDIAALAAVVGPAVVHGKHLTPECLKVVYDRMIALNVHSWENGTRAEATLEWNHPELSVYGAKDGKFYTSDLSADKIPEIIQIANDAMDQRPPYWDRTAVGDNTNSSDGSSSDESSSATQQRKRQETASSSTITPSATSTSSAEQATYTCDKTPAQMNRQLPPGSPLVPAAGAAGDPPSLGVPILLADKATNGGKRNNITYHDAASSQVNFTMYHVPRAKNGAISHRECTTQMWADNVYMVPPFLAFYGATTNNKTLMTEAVNQIKWYREILQDKDSKLWKHMSVGPEADDPSLWATGNAWVVAGTARVIATIKSSSFANDMQTEIADLQSLAGEVFNGCKDRLSPNGLLRNHLTNESSFEDSSASVLMASAGLRFSSMGLTNDYVKMSLTLLSAASRNVNASGYLTKVTDPQRFVTEGTVSGEGQSFIILAYAAYKDWDAAGKPGNPGNGNDDPLTDKSKDGKNGAATITGGVSALVAVALSLALVL